MVLLLPSVVKCSLSDVLILIVCIGNNKPTIKLLMKYKGEVAPHWSNLGTQLLEEKYANKLKIIQKDYPVDSERCCTEMFNHWLDVDTKASWNKLIDSLEQIGQNSVAEKIKEDIKEDKGINGVCYQSVIH